ncbi:hypothetical protein B0T14DRAFT_503184 [Immersiella caudata]|uniref:DUF1772-domain-containing protein n=1 Tax=Immersiella caudata TaxID=314043 RepID=A0AA40CBE7_9PEZI|nr:hypothetical protein B0T14DRAFT_503184 [Immersiella caudata]
MASSSNKPFLAASVTTLLLSSSLLSTSISYSTILTPRLLESPTPLMLTQWHASYRQGRKSMVPPALLTAAAYAYLATRPGLAKAKAYCYIAAAVLTVGIVPYTLGVMGKINRMLQRRAIVVERVGRGEVVAKEEREGLEDGEEGAWVKGTGDNAGSRYLVDQWGFLNLGRSLLLGTGLVLGYVALIY